MTQLFLTLLLTVSIIPLPNSVQEKKGAFILDSGTALVVREAGFSRVASDFADEISAPTGFTLQSRRFALRNAIVIKKDSSIPREGYTLKVRRGRIIIKASAPEGAFYALQSLRQLLPASIYGKVPSNEVWSVPCCIIKDAPRVAYRGMLLDCGRWFYPKEEIKKFIDLMAMHKQNYLQWHLTEDQGWRIEIRKYPPLTEVGAWREETKGYNKTGDGTPHGGFYTQDDIREIVEYASRRFITIIPEIELPGHGVAAIASYPRLSCTPDDGPKKVSTSWGVKEDVLCPRPETFKFLEDVFDEVLELFPSPYYHIGGDECPRTAWRNSEYCRSLADSLGLSGVDDLQYYFVKHFDKYLSDRGKTVIGWDEILDGSAVQSTVVMSYRGHAPAVKAMERDMKVILCPNRFCYYDYHQQEIDDNPKNHHLFITLRKAYNYNPAGFIGDSLMNAKGDHILGYQACMWGEHIPDFRQMEHQAFPRTACISEFCWTDDSRRDFDGFCVRLLKEFQRLDARNINYSRAFWQVIVNMNLENPYPREVELELDYPYARIHYTTDGSEPTFSSPVYSGPMTLSRGDVVRARGFMADGTPVGTVMTKKFQPIDTPKR